MQKIILLIILINGFNLMAIKPVKDFIQTPKDYGINYSDSIIETSDNAKINLWIINRDSALGTYLLAYGDAGNKSYLLYQAYYFFNQGYNVVMFDYRGFGNSSNFLHNENYLFHKEYFEDFKTVYQFCKSKTSKLHIYALSMGTIFASRISSDTNDIHIYDSPVLDLKFAVKSLKKNKSIQLHAPKISDLNSPKNIIIIYGQKDYLIRENDIFKFCRNSNAIIYKNNFGHIQTMGKIGLKYFELTNFF